MQPGPDTKNEMKNTEFSRGTTVPTGDAQDDGVGSGASRKPVGLSERAGLPRKWRRGMCHCKA